MARDLPQSKLKLRRRRRRIRISLFVAVIILLIFIMLVVLARAPFLRVASVVVSGAKTVPASSVSSLAQTQMQGDYWFVFPKDDILLYPKKAIAAAVAAQYPTFKSVDVHAQDFHTVAVDVVERQPSDQWCPSEVTASSTFPTIGAEGRDCDLMDADGVVYAPAGSSGSVPAGAVTYLGALTGPTQPQQYLTPEQFHALSALVAALSQVTGTTTVQAVSVGDDGDADDAEAQFSNGFVVKFSLNDASGDVFERFGLALKSDVFAAHQLSDFDYLDLRFGDKLYYKLKGS